MLLLNFNLETQNFKIRYRHFALPVAMDRIIYDDEG